MTEVEFFAVGFVAGRIDNEICREELVVVGLCNGIGNDIEIWELTDEFSAKGVSLVAKQGTEAEGMSAEVSRLEDTWITKEQLPAVACTSSEANQRSGEIAADCPTPDKPYPLSYETFKLKISRMYVRCSDVIELKSSDRRLTTFLAMEKIAVVCRVSLVPKAVTNVVRELDAKSTYGCREGEDAALLFQVVLARCQSSSNISEHRTVPSCDPGKKLANCGRERATRCRRHFVGGKKEASVGELYRLVVPKGCNEFAGVLGIFADQRAMICIRSVK